ncbi:chromosome segregation protein Spc25 [Nitzschia inconspicua]|uniref:Kinetochore protein SPC25 n=1 Tax=Nitzschia inconspicua TaxID=303405 RepID=A0A9K3LFA3_9STRA|nr:chromosome segregation protein Spc25 [Nitzschia inconspicua]
MPPYSSPFSTSSTHDDGVLERPHARAGGSTSIGFSSALLETIAVSKLKMEGWAQNEMAKADAVAESYRQRLLQEQAEIDARSTELLAIQMERGMRINNNENSTSSEEESNDNNIVSRKQALEEQVTAIQIEIMKLTTERDNRQRRIQDITLEEKKQQMRAQEARLLKEQVEEDKKTTLDDLTRGVINYKMLGLDFVRTDRDGRLRFCFTKLDSNDPSREFSFLLIVDDQDKFDIVECQPEIEATELVDILTELNRTEDMSALTRRMRRVFKNMCV